MGVFGRFAAAARFAGVWGMMGIYQVSAEPLAKIPNSHPERSGPKGRAVEGSPPRKERAPGKAKRYLTCGDPSTHSSNSLAQGDMKRRFRFGSLSNPLECP